MFSLISLAVPSQQMTMFFIGPPLAPSDVTCLRHDREWIASVNRRLPVNFPHLADVNHDRAAPFTNLLMACQEFWWLKSPVPARCGHGSVVREGETDGHQTKRLAAL